MLTSAEQGGNCDNVAVIGPKKTLTQVFCAILFGFPGPFPGMAYSPSQALTTIFLV
jgi:hypothetical protein